MISAERYAIKATAGTPTTFLAERRRNSACRAAAYAREHHRPTREDPFEIDGFDAIAVEFTPREAQLVELARSGLTKAEIAELLVIAIRSAETHLYRGMQTLA